MFTGKGHLIEAICHKLLQREAVLSFPFIFKLLRSRVTVSLFHKLMSLAQGDEETRARQNTVICYK